MLLGTTLFNTYEEYPNSKLAVVPISARVQQSSIISDFRKIDSHTMSLLDTQNVHKYSLKKL